MVGRAASCCSRVDGQALWSGGWASMVGFLVARAGGQRGLKEEDSRVSKLLGQRYISSFVKICTLDSLIRLGFEVG